MSRILNNEREHLRSLFNQAPGFVAVLMGPKHVFELANEAYYQLVGHREIIGKTVWEALPEVAGQGFEEFLERVYKTGVPWSARGMPIVVQPAPDGPTIQRYVDLVYQPYMRRVKPSAFLRKGTTLPRRWRHRRPSVTATSA
jgi:PAS domain-containing protein